MDLRVLLIADIDSPSGYSTHARELLKSLRDIDGVDLGLRLRKHDRTTIEIPVEDQEWYKSLMQKEWDKSDICIQFCTPELYLDSPLSYNIGFTQWETSRIPCRDTVHGEKDNWVKQMNQMDEIWTASSCAKQAFEDTGVETPVYVLTGPVNTDMFNPDGPELPIVDVNVDEDGTFIPREDRPMAIGLMAQWTRRKNIEEWLIWIMSQFQPGSVVGVLKTYGNSMEDEETHAALRKIKQAREMVVGLKGPKIVLITEKLTDDEIAQFYRSIDVYVSFSRGEGFGLPAVQAMATEKIVAHTSWSSVEDYLDESCGIPLNYTMEPVTGMTYNRWYTADQWWASVDILDATGKIGDIMRMMKMGTPEEKEKVLEMQTAARQRIIERCSISSITEKIKERLDVIQAGLETPV